jgi:hypothetical protein
MNRPARATQSEIARALRAAKEAGPEYGVEIAPDGTIRIAPIQARVGTRKPAGVEKEIIL